jgi:alcohol dehydrogenase class IV
MSRIKKFKLSVRRKTWLVCDRDRKSNESRDQNRRHIANRRIECSFFVVVTREVNSDAWFLKIVSERHNHSAILVEAHSVHRKLVMINEIKSEIFKALTVQIRSSQVLSSLRISDSVTEVNIDNSKNPRIVNSLFKSRDIYNVKTQIRRETLRSLTSVQINFFFESRVINSFN